MTFQNEKKMFLSKADKSKKGKVDEKIITLAEVINSKENYYTTSSCSGRVCLWRGNGKKNETEWIKVSHDLIDENFFVAEMDDKENDEQNNDEKNNDVKKGIIWLRLEPFILHVACRDIGSGKALLQKAKQIYKKSCLLSVSNKVIIEIRGSEFLEMPLYEKGKLLFSGDLQWLINLTNKKIEHIWRGINKFQSVIQQM